MKAVFTDEETKELWENCGFEWEIQPWTQQGGLWLYPDETRQHSLPPIDLENLFEYAVDSLKRVFYAFAIHDNTWQWTWQVRISHPQYSLQKADYPNGDKIATDQDLATALLRAIQQVFKDDGEK